MNKQTLRFVILAGLFLVPFIPFLVSSSFFFPFIVTKAFTWRIIVEIVFAAWVVLALLEPKYRPKKSVLLYSIATFLLVVGASNMFGVDPTRSFWSSFERMEGFITLLHLGAFFLVIGSVFDESLWKRWWNTSFVAAGIMVIYAFFQVVGVIEPSQGGARVDGTFGNTIYLAVYLLFHIYMAMFYMWREWRSAALRWTYGLLIIAQMFALYHTATRGAILGLLGGLLIFALLNLWNKEDARVRKISMGLLAALVLMIGGFFALRNTEFVSTSPVLSRFSSLNSIELKTQGRYFVWPIAFEGFKERPLLGWGQENFNYVFQKHYSPDMIHLEPWFDRAHNIFLDWMVQAGAVGLLAYLSLYACALYCIWGRAHGLSFVEKSILTSLLATYFFHNFFVFDHLVSYTLFFSLLAYVYSQTEGEPLWQTNISDDKATKFALPAVVILLVLSLYTLNIKPMQSNWALLDALRYMRETGEVSKVSERFEYAYNRSPLGRVEIIEQLSTNARTVLSNNTIPIQERNDFYTFAKQAAKSEAEKGSGNAKLQLFAGSFFVNTGATDEGLIYLKRAQELIPGKQVVLFEIGSAYISQNKFGEALAALKQAYELNPEYKEAAMVYLIGVIYASDKNLEQSLRNELDERVVVFEDRVLSAFYNNKRFNDVIALLERRKVLDPDNSKKYDDLILQVRNR